MTDKQIDIGQCPYEGECQLCKSACSVDVYCFIKQLFDERNIAEEQLYLKNKECEELKETVDGLLKVQYKLADSNKKLRQCLTEIKEVLQLYNNTTIGTDKGNGIFEFEVCNDNVLGGKLICYYNTNPAKKALKKIERITK